MGKIRARLRTRGRLRRSHFPSFKVPARPRIGVAGSLRVVAAYLAPPEAMKDKPRAVEVPLTEEIPGLSVPLTGAMDLVEGNFTPVDFKSEGSTRALACFMSRPRGMDGSHYSSGRSRDSTPDFSEGAEIHTRGRVCYPQTIRVTRPPADARKQRVVVPLETAVEGIVRCQLLNPIEKDELSRLLTGRTPSTCWK